MPSRGSSGITHPWTARAARHSGRAWVLLAAGAAALATGAVFSALAWSDYQDGEATDVHARRVELQRSADDRALVANVSFVAGAALAVTGGVWLAVSW